MVSLNKLLLLKKITYQNPNMMRILMLLLCLLSCCPTLMGQFGSQQVISVEMNGTKAVFADDIDGDGDYDIVATSEFDDKVSWFENLDGQGNFGEEKIISQSLHAAYEVYVAKIDNDAYLDIAIAAKGHNAQDGKIYWIKNLDGLGSFGEPQIISSLVQGPLAVVVADLNGDGFLDVVASSFVDNKVAWYKNIDGMGTFGGQEIIHNQAFSVRDVVVADLDGDGDNDVVAAAAGSDEVLWYQNLDGLGNFSSKKIVSNEVNGVLNVSVFDIDSDGYLDILASSPSDSKLVWFKNVDGEGNFGNEQIIASNLLGVRGISPADIDNDGDLDVFFVYTNTNPNGAIAWSENIDGIGTFNKPIIISELLIGAVNTFSNDLDNDGDLDVISASSIDDKIAWYENLTILNVADLEALGIKIYPNPAKEVLIIESPIVLKKVTLFSVLGNKLLEATKDLNEISLISLPSGMLLVELETEKGTIIEKILKE